MHSIIHLMYSIFDAFDNSFGVFDKPFDAFDNSFDVFDNSFDAFNNSFGAFDKPFDAFDNSFGIFDKRKYALPALIFPRKFQRRDHISERSDLL